jgi:lysophospholipase L1-like esterase
MNRMKSLRLLLSLLSVLPLLVTTSHAEAADVNLKKVHRIVTLGDSITEGGGRPGGYVWLIDHALRILYPDRKIEVVNAGISGHKSSDMLARFQRDVLDKKPDFVTISVGINDVWHGFTPEHPAGYGPNRVPPDDFRRNVAAMLDAAKKVGAKVVLFTTTIFEDEPGSARNLRVSFYNDALRGLAKEYGATLADQNLAFMIAWERNRPRNVRLTSDQVHLAAPGDRLMARTALVAMGVSEKRVDEALDSALKEIPLNSR